MTPSFNVFHYYIRNNKKGQGRRSCDEIGHRSQNSSSVLIKTLITPTANIIINTERKPIRFPTPNGPQPSNAPLSTPTQLILHYIIIHIHCLIFRFRNRRKPNDLTSAFQNVISAALLGARFRSNESSLLGDDGNANDFEVPAGVNMGRRRSRAVLYQLSGHYKPEKIKTKLKLNNVSIVQVRWSISCCRRPNTDMALLQEIISNFDGSGKSN